jgi:NhaP-type Na+/H+ or K+/H+ antiporter
MLLESLIGGLIIGLWVSYPLLRFYDRIPGKDPILKSVLLSSLVLVIVTPCSAVPQVSLQQIMSCGTSSSARYLT